MVHLAHERLRSPEPRLIETVGARLFAEGLAGAVSRRVVAGLSLDSYLWWDDRHTDWLGDCEQLGDEIVAALQADLELAEPLGERHFSARSEIARGWPVRCGYWCGLLAVDDLLATRAEAEVFGWGRHTAVAGLRGGHSPVAPARTTGTSTSGAGRR